MHTVSSVIILTHCTDWLTLTPITNGLQSFKGMHIAELMVNWDVHRKGVFTRFSRLFAILVLLAFDAYIYTSANDADTSYA